MKKEYDFLIVGSGLFGSVFAQCAIEHGKRCLVIDRRNHTGGNTYCNRIEGINVHTYGAHIFHTSDDGVWKYLNRFVSFNNFINSPLANYNGELYNLPFNMNTFHQLWGVRTADEAKRKIAEQQGEYAGIEPQNLEEQALQLVGRDIYEKLIKGYTEKQWGRKATELPSFIIKRLPLRFIYDNNYFNDKYQGIPVGGYNALTGKLLEGCDIMLNTDFLQHRAELTAKADTIVYSGMLDAYFDYRLGNMEYRSLLFDTKTLNTANFQSNAVINYTSADVPFTRIIEHKHFEFGTQHHTVITIEYPMKWKKGREAYYPVNDAANDRLANEYRILARKEANVIFGGRLADYRYYDMDQVIRKALDAAEQALNTGR
ncbi:MAG: UDP-galactopyranose mutase [bacterium]|uniref:UDP-galactopyranose mutase n=1 Tax=Candidatus Aphodosoma intestinipullorum TaxID=2840674 RepID=A0A940DJ52_9BACT|nr:UDP-galactopyranose mutase [Candidatus Aphodosoma intestinipullorum]